MQKCSSYKKTCWLRIHSCNTHVSIFVNRCNIGKFSIYVNAKGSESHRAGSGINIILLMTSLYVLENLVRKFKSS